MASLLVDLGHSEICRDVARPLEEKTLLLSLETTEPWYVPGEIVQAKLVFTNKSSELLSVPSDLSGLSGDLEYLNQDRLPNGDLVWTSVSTRTPVSSSFRSCDSTLRPKVLQPGEVFELPLSDLDSWYAGKFSVSTPISFAPTSFGRRKIRFTSAPFEIDGNIVMKKPKSFELICLATPIDADGKTQCGEAAIVRTEQESIVLLSTSLSQPKDKSELNFYIEYIARAELALNFNVIPVLSSRVLLKPGRLSFLRPPATRVSRSVDLLDLISQDQERLKLRMDKFALRSVHEDH